MPPHRRRPLLLVLVLAAGPALGACTGGSDESAPDLLARARTVLDQARSVHFVLDGGDAPTTGTALVGGEGDVQRPASFQGSLRVLAAGTAVAGAYTRAV